MKKEITLKFEIIEDDGRIRVSNSSLDKPLKKDIIIIILNLLLSLKNELTDSDFSDMMKYINSCIYED